MHYAQSFKRLDRGKHCRTFLQKITWGLLTLLFFIYAIPSYSQKTKGDSQIHPESLSLNKILKTIPLEEKKRILNSDQKQISSPTPSIPSTSTSDQKSSNQFVKILIGPVKVVQSLEADAPILGMAQEGSHYQLTSYGETWCQIIFENRKGWIERSKVTIVSEPGYLTVLKEFFISFVIIASIGGIFLIVFLLTNRKDTSQEELFASVRIAKKVLLISMQTTYFNRYVNQNQLTFEHFFKELGFDTLKASDSKTCAQMIFQYLPEAILVDWQLGTNVQSIMERIMLTKTSTSSIFLLFYNVPNVRTVKQSSLLTRVQYLGQKFTDRELLNVITPYLLTNDNKGLSIRKSVEGSALQGKINAGNLSEVLQFIEIGKKTGCLLIQDERPSGIIYFNNGIIIYAASRHYNGKKAVFDILNLQRGKFLFVLNKRPKMSNCNIATLMVLMEWTKLRDETVGYRLRQA